ncbi:MAG: aminopeptidase N [Xanthomonadales bacterium]|nr:aminopeptidase N [Xanthomonadales bacterium]
MRVEAAVTIHRSDYRPPDYRVQSIELDVSINPDGTVVSCTQQLECRKPGAPLRLDGEDLELLSVKVEGEDLECQSDAHGITLPARDGVFSVQTVVRIQPDQNTALEGLYRSGSFLLTQCEAEGFRKITYALDRPDVMARYRVRIEADAASFPVLLSNGNLVETGECGHGRHFVVWDDPFPKPSYLFALVAGDLGHIEDRYRTADGREVTLRIYAEHENLSRLDHAMASLVASMRWDESRFGLSYDLDVYNIVATNDFNMGAMENKSLNIFNAKYVLASPDTATDWDYQAIEGVIGHEYFHNWTGNRVTCRDWFQLSLKEGLTVFRDQEFSSDQRSRAVKRIGDVRTLRSMQFPEDAGPMAHPVRPDSYIEINNFYTLTVYEKGAEVVRMMHTLLGEDGFQRGMRLYFERHDGQAVTCDDFRQAMADANQVDLGQFERWYAQAGTPRVTATGAYDADSRQFTLSLSQSTPPTAGQEDKLPLHMPVRLGLVGKDGRDLDLVPAEDTPGTGLIGQGVIELTREQQDFVFEQVSEEPLASLFRGFSAPVICEVDYSPEQLAFLMQHDADSFNRWDAGQRLATRVILDGVAQLSQGDAFQPPDVFIEAAGGLIRDRDSDPALLAEALALPDEAYLGEQTTPVPVDPIHQVRTSLVQAIADRFRADIENRWRQLGAADSGMSGQAMAARSLKNLLLGYLAAVGQLKPARQQYHAAANMTDRLAALRAAVHHDAGLGDELLGDFYQRWHDDPLVMDKWLAVQASSPRPDTLDRVRNLMGDPVFSMRNPNKVRSLIGVFSRNPTAFHAADGSGYRFVADQILAVDALNPQVAARQVGVFNAWRRYDESRQGLMERQLDRMHSHDGLSRDVGEIVGKALESR